MRRLLRSGDLVGCTSSSVTRTIALTVLVTEEVFPRYLSILLDPEVPNCMDNRDHENVYDTLPQITRLNCIAEGTTLRDALSQTQDVAMLGAVPNLES
jgi:hypothetical protein